MERIIGYDKKELTVYYQPSIFDMLLGDSSKTIVYVNIGEKYFPTTDIKWINKSTGEERRCENFDNYVKAQETIKNERK